MTTAHDPKSDPKGHPSQEGERRHTEERRDTRQDPSRKGHGPDNPLPGEPGGPSTSGHIEPSEPADKDKDKTKDHDHGDHAR